VNAIQADFCWELVTQSPLAGNIPPYLAGSWKFSQRHPGSAEQLFFSLQEKKNEKNVSKTVLASCFYVVFRILLITVVGCPCCLITSFLPECYNLEKTEMLFFRGYN